MWMREPRLSDCDKVDCGRFIVHGHTPLRSGQPELAGTASTSTPAR